MFNKIQNYLLTHRPLLWNIRIIPVLCGTVLINLFFFLTGFLSTELDFSSYYGGPFSNKEFIIFGAVVSALLCFIFWLIIYSKNNAFKVFYPKTTKSLYLEFLLIFVIVFSMVLFPYSFYQGVNNKVKSYSTEKEIVEAIKVLKMVDILIPETKTDYFKEYPDGEEKYDVDSYSSQNDSVYISPIERAIQQAEQESKIFENYPDFTQLSLLNYSGYSRLYIPARYDIKAQNYETVISWLKNKDKEKIEKLMADFLALHEKHQLETNLTVDKWMELVYNPNKYPVGDFNLISRHNLHPKGDYYRYSYRDNSSSSYYLHYEELVNGYENLLEATKNKEIKSSYILVVICFALSLTLLVFAYRVTSGKTWLIAFVSMGVILVINSFISIIFAISADGIAGPLNYIIIMLVLFIVEAFIIFSKIANNKAKGRSGVMINHFIGFIPLVPVLLYALVFIISEETCDAKYSQDCFYRSMEKYIILFMWGNVCLTFISMWLFIRFVLLKWKSLPEQ
ncbi:MAG: hypothetical protein E6772_05065 [Dysgonomonas sp.]|nr:hypothetical protein [Dysgonomonas sp.]